MYIIVFIQDAVCKTMAKTGTAITFKLLLSGVSPLDSRLPDMLFFSC